LRHQDQGLAKGGCDIGQKRDPEVKKLREHKNKTTEQNTRLLMMDD
jgi:hypothetical protein